MTAGRNTDVCRMGDLVGPFVQALRPLHERYDSLAQVWDDLLPDNLRDHCRLGSLADGSIKVFADESSYLCELQWCRSDLLRQLQRLCPTAKVRRIEVAMGR
jgi:hypothetical protein